MKLKDSTSWLLVSSFFTMWTTISLKQLSSAQYTKYFQIHRPHVIKLNKKYIILQILTFISEFLGNQAENGKYIHRNNNKKKAVKQQSVSHLIHNHSNAGIKDDYGKATIPHKR